MAFFLLRLGDFMNRIVQRKYLHITSIVNIQRCLNENFDLLHENVYKFEAIVNQFQSAKLLGNSILIVNSVNKINFDNISFNSLANMDYFNELLNYKGKLRRFNDDIDNLFKSIEKLKDLRLSNNITDQIYMFNLELSISKLGVLIKANEMLKEITIDLLSKSRIIYKSDRSIFQKLYFKLVKKRYKKNFTSLVRRERIKVEKEINEHTKKDKKFLDDVFGEKK